MFESTVRVRPARESEAEALSDLCLRSKAHWGYDAAFLDQCREALRVRTASIREGLVFVAADGYDRPVGVYQIDVEGETADLALLFVEPELIGRGLGRRLLEHAVERAHALGCTAVTILADPNTATFYEAQGAVLSGMRPSDAVQGRMLPFYRYDLGSAARNATG